MKYLKRFESKTINTSDKVNILKDLLTNLTDNDYQLNFNISKGNKFDMVDMHIYLKRGFQMKDIIDDLETAIDSMKQYTVQLDKILLLEDNEYSFDIDDMDTSGISDYINDKRNIRNILLDFSNQISRTCIITELTIGFLFTN